MIYRFPKMTAEHEFASLDFVAKYSDTMFAQTGDMDWCVVYEWDDDALDFDEATPPGAVLLRSAAGWERRRVIATRVDGGWSLQFIDDDRDKPA